MRILHVSHNSLPDARVERAAYTARKRGWDVSFAGNDSNEKSAATGLFNEIIALPFSTSANLHLPPAWVTLKKHFVKVLSAIKPDMIHAHNIVAARLAYESNVNFVYDDHEYWSKSSGLTDYAALNPLVRFEKHLTKTYASRVWSSWEREIISQVPVLTISETVADDHRKLGKDIFVVPSMPNALELPQEEIPAERSTFLSSVYIGKELSSRIARHERDVSGLTDLFSSTEHGRLVVIGDDKLRSKSYVDSIGFLDYLSMMRELTKHHVGLIPWKPFWFHKYCNPNKAYEYVNAGLLVLATFDLTNVLKTLGSYCIPIQSYEGLAKQLGDLKGKLSELDGRRDSIIRFARANCVWERYENRVFDAYSLA